VSDSPESPPQIGYRDTSAVLRRLGDLVERIVLVGGQAVNFWADFYQSRVPEVKDLAPFTSKDIDFLGTRASMEACAARLQRRSLVPDPDGIDETGLNSGTTTFIDENQHVRQIQFLTAIIGIEDTGMITRTAAPVEVIDAEGVPTGIYFRVMHPVLCLISRAANTQPPLSRLDPHSLKQLRCAIFCAREYLRDLLESGTVDDVREVLEWSEHIYRFSRYDSDGKNVLRTTNMDPFEAVIGDHPRLPLGFREQRYPQLKEYLHAYRERLAASDSIRVLQRAAKAERES